MITIHVIPEGHDVPPTKERNDAPLVVLATKDPDIFEVVKNRYGNHIGLVRRDGFECILRDTINMAHQSTLET